MNTKCLSILTGPQSIAISLFASVLSVHAVQIGVSNFGEGDAFISVGVHGQQWMAMGFTTGSTEPGWWLDSVVIRAYNMGQAAPDFWMALYSDVGGLPGTKLADLNGPIPGGLSLYSYSPAQGTMIQSSSSYWVLAATGIAETRPPDIFGWWQVGPTSETGLPGWSISDGWSFSGNQGGSWSRAVNEPGYLQISVSPVPDCGPSSILVGLLWVFMLSSVPTRKLCRPAGKGSVLGFDN